MFIDDCPYLENNHGDENMNMRPMPYMAWGDSPMYNPYMPNMASSMDNINYDNMNRCNNNITNEDEDYIYIDNRSPMTSDPPQTTPTPSPAPAPTTQFVPSVQDDILYNQGYLKTQIGKRVKIEFLIGTNMLIDREGTLVGVGISYVLINEVDTNDLIMADMYSIKFVRIFD
ncbi:TPA: alginate lyase [Clostridium botulinum]|uniref:alginate lyase n=1 Tax=Clostridium botulinum TaxID=1491 RepID=UPI000D0D54E6|nr:alginate lyase [Clostridium botulinum]PSL98113.1 alginate lyase [Clostridium botulinum]HDK7138227.1 alginate lyase [Clostridium botulinum]HDK7141555.1 alginate lyase [Clostridium botulinum]HDK7145378.1 alginate lyase [Clostridium botulinum]HDK7149030.1 alginate lyase [Clostridium botulinum]